MAQITSGVRSVLSLPAVYDIFQRMLGANRSRLRLVKDHIRVEPGNVVIDVGCGTAEILDFLPEGIEYHGFDLSPQYIEAARARHGSRGVFHCRDIASLQPGELPKCDVAIAIGLLHHLDDPPARHLLQALKGCMAPGARLITVDPAYWEPQSSIARMLIERDRGRNVRRGEEYAVLARTAFDSVRVVRRDDLLNIPYSHAVLECLS